MSFISRLTALPGAAGAAGGLPEIGEEYEGGYFAGQISTAGNGVADYNLVVSPKASGEPSSELALKTVWSYTSGTDSEVDGSANTAAMMAASPSQHPAANFCAGLTINGYSDWYLPSRYEYEILFYNFKPTTDDNYTVVGGNPYAVPSRTGNYTVQDPSQTAVSLFQSGGGEEILGFHHTSTMLSSNGRSWIKGFGASNPGYEDVREPTGPRPVRAIRRVPV